MRYRLGDSLSRCYTTKFFASGVQMESHGSLADPQDYACFQCGFAGRSPF